MGSIVPVLSTVAQVGSVLGTVANVVQPFVKDNAARVAQKQTQTLQSQVAAQDAALQKQQNQLASDIAETNRRAALRRAVARQRANFGAQGVGADGGSSEAVLLGLFDQSDEDRANQDKLDSLRTTAIDQNLGQQQQLNLLQQTQLREKQYVDYLSRI